MVPSFIVMAHALYLSINNVMNIRAASYVILVNIDICIIRNVKCQYNYVILCLQGIILLYWIMKSIVKIVYVVVVCVINHCEDS